MSWLIKATIYTEKEIRAIRPTVFVLTLNILNNNAENL